MKRFEAHVVILSLISLSRLLPAGTASGQEQKAERKSKIKKEEAKIQSEVISEVSGFDLGCNIG